MQGLILGFMIAEVAAAALMSENKQMVRPALVDSAPTQQIKKITFQWLFMALIAYW
ncbi:histidine ammonia-lyase [Bartonella sp. JB63]|nr:histidine ammonia-lyase [Bartonella sp. JB15]AQX29377.1 histidine ammonia-lyase [Bartonella sp. JB63]